MRRQPGAEAGPRFTTHEVVKIILQEEPDKPEVTGDKLAFRLTQALLYFLPRRSRAREDSTIRSRKKATKMQVGVMRPHNPY